LTLGSEQAAEKASRRLNGGEEWEKVAADLAPGGPGDAIWVYPELLPPDLKAAIVETGPGEFSDVAQSTHGFSIFEVVEIEPGHRPDAPEEVARLKRAYERTRRRAALAQWLADLKSQADIDVNPEFERKWFSNPAVRHNM
jgi:parvulin-like peptidyl-prolyl isomerase